MRRVIILTILTAIALAGCGGSGVDAAAVCHRLAAQAVREATGDSAQYSGLISAQKLSQLNGQEAGDLYRALIDSWSAAHKRQLQCA